MINDPGESVDCHAEAGIIHLLEATSLRLREASAIIDAISQHKMLSELPSSTDGRRNHQTAVSLLSVLGRDLALLTHEIEAAVGVSA